MKFKMVVSLCNLNVSRAVKAAKMFSHGQSRRLYMVRKEILQRIGKLKRQKSSGDGKIAVCKACASLLEFKGLFDSFYYRAAY